MSIDEFTLLPADEVIEETADLDAAELSALEATGAVPVGASFPQPFGRTPKFDFVTGRMVRAGGAPVWVSGLEAVAQWCNMASRVAAGAHPAIFSEGFGMEEPDSVLGEAATAEEEASDWGERLLDALSAYDRVTAVENYDATYDRLTGTLSINTLDVITDTEDRLSLGPLEIPVGGLDG